MSPSLRHVVAAIAALYLEPQGLAHAETSRLADPHVQNTTLPNGLEVWVEEDHRSSAIAIDVRFALGSGDDPPERSGMADLAGKILERGETVRLDERSREDVATAMGTSIGVAKVDVDDRFTDLRLLVPSSSLELALFIEADRVSSFADGLTARRFDAARSSVDDSRADARSDVTNRVRELFYGRGHPYGNLLLSGDSALEDLSVREMRTWLRAHYAPVRIVLSGDVTPVRAFELVAKYFGAPLAPTERPADSAPKLLVKGNERITLEAEGNRTVLAAAWPTPKLFEQDDIALDALARVLAGRVRARLVAHSGIASSVSVLQHSLPEASAFIIELGLLDGHGPDECVRYLDAELARIAHDGPSEDELASAKATLLAGVASSRDGSANRAKTLQSNLSEAHDPARFVGYAASYSALRPSQIAQAAAEWLVSDRRVLLVLQRRGTPAAASRSKKNGSQPQRPAAVNDARWLAPPTSVAAVPFVDPPDRYDAPLPVELVSAEGYRIQLIERHTVPIVRVSAVIRWEQPFPNIASRGLRERLLVAAHAPRSELGLQDSLRDAGATLSWDDKLETTTLSLLAYPDRMAAALEALMAVLRARRVPVEELNRLRPVGWLERQTLSPSTMANVWARHLLAPPKHRYSIALDGGLAELQAMGVSDFERYFDQSMQPSAVTIDVVGDVSEARLAKLLRASPAKPRAARPTTSFAWATGTFLVDQKGAKGVDVVVALPHPMRDDPDAAAAAVVEAGFFDRLNDAFNAHGIDSWSNRTEKLWELRDGSLDYFTVHVEKDKLLPLVGLLVERCALVLDRAYMATHLARVGASEVFAPLLRDDSTKNILGSLNELAAIDVSPRSALDYERRLRAVTMEQVLEAAKKYFKPFAMRIVAFGEVGGIVNQLGRLPIAPVKTLSDDAHRVAR